MAAALAALTRIRKYKTFLYGKENLAGAKPLGAGGSLSCTYVNKNFINSYSNQFHNYFFKKACKFPETKNEF